MPDPTPLAPGPARWRPTLLLGLVLLAAAGPGPARGEPAPQAATVDDPRHGLQWRRCVEGQRWEERRCQGEPLRLTLTQAQARARAAGAAWRLPRLPELRLLMRHGEGPDLELFPQAPRDWHWSATTVLRTAPLNPYNYGNVMRGRAQDGSLQADDDGLLLGWAVDLASGASREQPRSSRLLVRLVRSQAPDVAASAAAR